MDDNSIIAVMARTDARRYRSTDNIITFNRPKHVTKGETSALLRWIDRNTTGRFLLTVITVGFVNEKDAMYFKLGWKYANNII